MLILCQIIVHSWIAGTVKVNILNNPIPPFLLASCKQKGLHAKQKFTLQLFDSKFKIHPKKQANSWSSRRLERDIASDLVLDRANATSTVTTLTSEKVQWLMFCSTISLIFTCVNCVWYCLHALATLQRPFCLAFFAAPPLYSLPSNLVLEPPLRKI